MSLTGRLIIGFERVSTGETFRAVDGRPMGAPAPRATSAWPGAPRSSGPAHSRRRFRCVSRDRARVACRNSSSRCAANLLALGEELLRARLGNRACRARAWKASAHAPSGQLRLFAQVVRARRLARRCASIRALPERKPLPRADLRHAQRSRSARSPCSARAISRWRFPRPAATRRRRLAAGCPVDRESPPRPPRHVGACRPARSARRPEECGLPGGTYSHLGGPSNDLGRRW